VRILYPYRAEGTCPALASPVNFYDVLADGYHTPLTKIQITKLFHAGRLSRNHPCKQVERKEWRTIDELFPLLKYDSSGASMYEAKDRAALLPRGRVLILLAMGGIAALALLYFFLLSSSDDLESGIPNTISPKRMRRIENVSSTTYPSPGTYAAYQQSNSAFVVETPSNDAPRQSSDSQQARLALERTNAEQRQLQQAQLAQERANSERAELERKKAAGQNVIVPLDQWVVLQNVGGLDVNVKIHENDVTTFDVWVNGSSRREVLKQKGISGSRTDETLIYRNGRAKLYYVWEISGTLNHCLLRVRDE
jgi:hypothetical protein